MVWSVNGVGWALPFAPAPTDVSTQANRSILQPLGLSGVAYAVLQSACCQFW